MLRHIFWFLSWAIKPKENLKSQAMKLTITLTGMLLCFIAICLAAVTDLGGKWTGTVTLPDGKVYPLTYIFETNGDQLTGTAQAEGDPKAIIEGRISGSDFSFNIVNDDGTGMPHTGKYYPQGDSIAITIKYAGNELHPVLKRATKP